MGTVRIPLSSRKYPNLYALIDEDDYEMVSQYSWWPAVRGRNMYAVGMVDGKECYLHRLITNFPEGKEVDHINRDGLDNRRCNLRVVEKAENARNSRAVAGTSSQYKGVTETEFGWMARIKFPKAGYLWLGRHREERFAAKVYDAAAVHFYGEFAHPNFPDDPIDPHAQTTFEKFLAGPTFASKFLGVTKTKKPGRWLAQMRHEGRHYWLGRYDTQEEAALAFDRKARELRGPDTRTNFPLDETERMAG